MGHLRKDWRKRLPYQSQLLRFTNLKNKNKKFHSLSLEEQKKEIALDVISLLDISGLRANQGGYWDSSKLLMAIDTAVDSHDFQFKVLEITNEEDANCEVCARGAMMVSTIRLGNSLNPNNYHRTDSIKEGNQETQPYFSKEEIEDMECHYEYSNSRGAHSPFMSNSFPKMLNIFLQVVYNGRFRGYDIEDYVRRSNILNR